MPTYTTRPTSHQQKIAETLPTKFPRAWNRGCETRCKRTASLITKEGRNLGGKRTLIQQIRTWDQGTYWQDSARLFPGLWMQWPCYASGLTNCHWCCGCRSPALAGHNLCRFAIQPQLLTAELGCYSQGKTSEALQAASSRFKPCRSLEDPAIRHEVALRSGREHSGTGIHESIAIATGLT